jgi:hypothetical protein
VQIIRLKEEIKLLHVKKEKQIIMLYRLHLKSAQEWGSTLYNILDSTNRELEKKYKTIEMKLQTLVRTQIKKLKTQIVFTVALSTKLT